MRRVLFGFAVLMCLPLGRRWPITVSKRASTARTSHSKRTAQDYFNAHPGDPEGLDGPIGPTPLHPHPRGRAYRGWRVVLLVAGREIRILSLDGAPLRHLVLDPTKDYQPMV